MRAVKNFTGVHDVVKIQRAGGFPLRINIIKILFLVKIWSPDKVNLQTQVIPLDGTVTHPRRNSHQRAEKKGTQIKEKKPLQQNVSRVSPPLQSCSTLSQILHQSEI